MSTDYRELIATAYDGPDGPFAISTAEPTSVPCSHPNAPIIADLLRWGTNVATTEERPDRESCVEFNGYLYGEATDLLNAHGEGT